MDETWVEVVKQAPNLCGLIFIVVTFLRHIKDNEKERLMQGVEKSKIFSAIIDRNTLALNRNSEMFGHVSHVFKEELKMINNIRDS